MMDLQRIRHNLCRCAVQDASCEYIAWVMVTSNDLGQPGNTVSLSCCSGDS